MKKSLKRVVKAVPLFIFIFILGILCAYISIKVALGNYGSEVEAESINIAIVKDEGNDDTQVLGKTVDFSYVYRILNEMDSVKDNLNIEMLSSKEAYVKLNKGEVSAVIELPEDFLNSIINGENKPAVIVTSSKRLMEGAVIREVAESASVILSNAQAYIYASYDELEYLNAAEDIKDGINRELNYNFIIDTLGRENKFNIYNIYTADYQKLAVASNFLFVIFISVIGLFSVMREEEEILWQRIGMAGFNKNFACISEFIAGTVLYIPIVFIVILLVNMKYKLSLDAYISIAVSVFTMVIFALSILGISKKTYNMLIPIFVTGFLMNFCSGGFIPLEFIPESLRINNPMYECALQLSYILDKRNDLISNRNIIIYFILSVLLFFFIYRLRKEAR